MKASELIAYLEKQDPNLEVYIDCSHRKVEYVYKDVNNDDELVIFIE